MRCEFSTAHKNSCGSVWNQAVGPPAHCFMPSHVYNGQFFETLLCEYTTLLNKFLNLLCEMVLTQVFSGRNPRPAP